MAIGESWLVDRILIWIPLVMSLTVHEWAHAWSANALGDDTAARQGRLTLDPLAHLDPVGTVLLPLIGVPFGWARPVPIDPGRFRGGTDAGIVLTAAAGPLANLVLAGGATLALAGLAAFAPAEAGPASAARRLLEMLVIVNVLLAVFNLLPVPPLDGSRIVDGLVPDRLRGAWDAFVGLGPVTLGVVIAVPLLLGVHLFAGPIGIAEALIESATALAQGAGAAPR
jgi:Zn-dependent protease